MKVLLPDAESFAEREHLRKEEEELNSILLTAFEPCGKSQRCGKCVLRDQKRKLAEKLEALDEEKLRHLRQRARVLEEKLDARKVSIKTDGARESAHGHDCVAHDEPDTKVGGSPKTKPWLTIDVTYVPTRERSAKSDATEDDKNQIKQANEIPRIRERESFKAQSKDWEERKREFEAHGEDRKMCVQELNAPKGDQSSPFASTMSVVSMVVLGSMVAACVDF